MQSFRGYSQDGTGTRGRDRVGLRLRKLRRLRRLRFAAFLAMVLWALAPGMRIEAQESGEGWRAATPRELQARLPARATVEKEHIETEMRTASGITDGRGRYVAGLVLITAGYSADGKYSHFLVVQAPLRVGELALGPGEYVFGWQREGESLNVHFYDAATGVMRGSAMATYIQKDHRVESFKIWPTQGRSLIQIGRFGIPYRLGR